MVVKAAYGFSGFDDFGNGASTGCIRLRVQAGKDLVIGYTDHIALIGVVFLGDAIGQLDFMLFHIQHHQFVTQGIDDGAQVIPGCLGFQLGIQRSLSALTYPGVQILVQALDFGH
jgi:hypothetical protein